MKGLTIKPLGSLTKDREEWRVSGENDKGGDQDFIIRGFQNYRIKSNTYLKQRQGNALFLLILTFILRLFEKSLLEALFKPLDNL
ncbi:hypothetical protein [Emticicia sp. BO119]|uniref:hypothetical protein n=1 Tax=Emticicia sp. BO119 TaxID=2757768 RepID=UPI0015F01E3D|nr:hypothetical protein [Emticicia sp. BO119]MBA4851944.1 hypothetical protein [Emticicia sp. BO119]